MATKRDLQDVEQHDSREHGPKRAKKQTGATPRHQHQNSSIDPTWGQKYVFSSSEDATTIPYGEESDFEDDSDAMAYLMSVRKEAYDIPHLLVAPKVEIGPQLPPEFRQEGNTKEDDQPTEDGYVDRDIYTNGVGDTRGYYDDGAYIALPEEDNDSRDDDDDDDSNADPTNLINEAYFASIMNQYKRLRKVLSTQPPANGAKRLSPIHHPTFAAAPSRNSNTNKIWSTLMRTTDPHPLQLAFMSKETVIRIIRVLIGGTFLRRGHSLTERTSHWLWGLLARLPERGELNHVEIGWIRDLGRRAVLLGRSLAEMAALREELAEGELGVNECIDDSSTNEDVVGTDPEDIENYEGESESLENHVEHGLAEPGTKSAVYETNSGRGAEEEEEEGEIQECSENGDAAMDLDSGSEAEQDVTEDDLEAAKQGLLARLDGASTDEQDEADAEEEARMRLRMNMRATLNMILTVAGEFYGQRDLLEFRQPFVGM